MRRRLADSYKGGLDERRRRYRTKGAKRLHPGKRRIVPQDARWDLVQMRRAGGGPKKVKGSA